MERGVIRAAAAGTVVALIMIVAAGGNATGWPMARGGACRCAWPTANVPICAALQHLAASRSKSQKAERPHPPVRSHRVATVGKVPPAPVIGGTFLAAVTPEARRGVHLPTASAAG
jgi:hypothetical protein